MKIGFIGGGHFGHNLANLLAQAGHEVVVGLRDNRRVKPAAQYRVASMTEAALHGEAIVIAVLYTSCASVLPPLAAVINDKIVVDATNALREDWSPLLPPDQSAAQNIAQWLPTCRLVKAFNTVFADVMRTDRLDRDSHRVTVFVAGDDDQANACVADLATDAGFTPLITGGLANSRYLEAMAHLNIQIALGRSGGTNAAFLYHQIR